MMVAQDHLALIVSCLLLDLYTPTTRWLASPTFVAFPSLAIGVSSLPILFLYTVFLLHHAYRRLGPVIYAELQSRLASLNLSYSSISYYLGAGSGIHRRYMTSSIGGFPSISLESRRFVKRLYLLVRNPEQSFCVIISRAMTKIGNVEYRGPKKIL